MYPNYAAAVFLLSADEELWDKVHRQVLDTGIYFDRIRLGGVTLNQYILFHAAKDVYNGTKHIRLSELTDRELIPDEVLRLIVNAFVIEKSHVIAYSHGVDEEALKKLQAKCTDEVKRINGAVTFEDAYFYQNQS